MLNVLSSWDLVAGSDEEFNTAKKLHNVPANEIMVYMLDGELFKKILDLYPSFRSFIVTRSMVRRQFFRKVFVENRE